eukprot:4288115-Prymnesium_polylepis.1
MERQLARLTPPRQALAAGPSPQHTLSDLAAWLVVNSMRSEAVQFNMLCQQNLSNIWRKRAFEVLLDNHKEFKATNRAFINDLIGDSFIGANGQELHT